MLNMAYLLMHILHSHFKIFHLWPETKTNSAIVFTRNNLSVLLPLAFIHIPHYPCSIYLFPNKNLPPYKSIYYKCLELIDSKNLNYSVICPHLSLFALWYSELLFSADPFCIWNAFFIKRNLYDKLPSKGNFIPDLKPPANADLELKDSFNLYRIANSLL